MPFTRPTLASLITRSEAEVSSRLGLGPLLKRSALAVLARIVAGLSHLIHGHLDYLARQILADTADGDHLERHASLYKITRKAALFANGDVVFTGVDASIIPIGSRLQRADGAEFDTTELGTILLGKATVDVKALVAGAAGDTAAATILNLTSPISGVNTAATVDTAGITGGADQETDAGLLERLLQELREVPQGGSPADYVKWGLAVAEVTRAFALENHLGLGTVGVVVMVDDDPLGPLPDAAKVIEVAAYIENNRRPVTAKVTVFIPGAVNLDPQVQIFPDTQDVRDSVKDNLEAMLRRDAKPGGTILVSRVREAISTAKGETDYILHRLNDKAPADVTSAAGSIVLLGTITFFTPGLVKPDPAVLDLDLPKAVVVAIP